jgi:hypothetical protein
MELSRRVQVLCVYAKVTCRQRRNSTASNSGQGTQDNVLQYDAGRLEDNLYEKQPEKRWYSAMGIPISKS